MKNEKDFSSGDLLEEANRVEMDSQIDAAISKMKDARENWTKNLARVLFVTRVAWFLIGAVVGTVLTRLFL